MARGVAAGNLGVAPAKAKINEYPGFLKNNRVRQDK